MASDRPLATMAAEQVGAGEHGTLILFGYKSYEVGIVLLCNGQSLQYKNPKG